MELNEEFRFLMALKEYIELVEDRLEVEFGASRSLQELINGKKMPVVYYDVLRRLGK